MVLMHALEVRAGRAVLLVLVMSALANLGQRCVFDVPVADCSCDFLWGIEKFSGHSIRHGNIAGYITNERDRPVGGLELHDQKLMRLMSIVTNEEYTTVMLKGKMERVESALNIHVIIHPHANLVSIWVNAHGAKFCLESCKHK